MNEILNTDHSIKSTDSLSTSRTTLVGLVTAAILSGCAGYHRTYTPPAPIYKVEKDRAGHIVREETIRYNPQTGRCEKTVVTDKKTTYDNNATCPAAIRGKYRYY